MMKEENNFKIDIKETLLRNLLWIPMFIFVAVFASIGISYAPSFVDEKLKLMFLVFSLFFTLKLIVWVGHPTICLKEKSYV